MKSSPRKLKRSIKGLCTALLADNYPTCDTIKSYEDELPQDLIIYAMQKAVLSRVRKISYIKSILDEWINKGITTLAEAKEEKKDAKLIKLNFTGGNKNDPYGI